MNLALEICIKFLLVNTDKIISVKIIITIISMQCAKKVMSKSLGLVDFAIGLVNFVLNLPDGQTIFFYGNSHYRRTGINPAPQNFFPGLLKSCWLRLA